MEDWQKWGLGILAGIFLVLLFGPPSNINILGFGWDFNDDKGQGGGGSPATVPTNSELVVKNELVITSFQTTQNIYAPEETARIEFKVRNTLEVPYNITVNWFHDGKRERGWFNTSTEIYTITNPTNNYEAWLPLNGKAGEWQVQLILDYVYQDKSLREEKVAVFNVI